MSTVSVIMPAYNQEKLIDESIKSILNQSFQDWELIIINDGSTDKTLNVIKHYANEYPKKIVVIDKEINEGIVAGLNDGLRVAKGEYICWLSSDDLYTSDKLEKQILFLQNHEDLDLVFSGFDSIDIQGNYLSSNILQIEENDFNVHKKLLLSCIIHGCSIMVKKRAYIKVGFFNSKYKYAHDYDMWLRLISDYSIGYIPEPLVKGRIHPGQLTNLGMNEIDAIHVLFDFLEHNPNLDNYILKAGFKNRLECFDFVYSRLYFMYRFKPQELGALQSRISNYCGHYNININQLPKYQNTINKLNKLSQSNMETSLNIPLIEIETRILKYICDVYNLDAFFINKEAIRFNRYKEVTLSILDKAIPHTNLLYIITLPKEVYIEIIEEHYDGLYYYSGDIENQENLKVGLSEYMLFSDKLYSSKLSPYLKENTGDMIREIVFDGILDDAIKEIEYEGE